MFVLLYKFNGSVVDCDGTFASWEEAAEYRDQRDHNLMFEVTIRSVNPKRFEPRMVA